jgi:hypothetical protein
MFCGHSSRNIIDLLAQTASFSFASCISCIAAKKVFTSSKQVARKAANLLMIIGWLIFLPFAAARPIGSKISNNNK